MTDKVLEPNKWVDNYGDILYNYIMKRINNDSVAAEDIVQEVFLSAWKARETYNKVTSEKTWLFSICKNKIIDYYRKLKTFENEYLESSFESESFFTDDGHFKDEYKATSNWKIEGTDILYEKEFFVILNKCKGKLKKLQENVFSMKYLYDINADEICETLDISNQNYWVAMHRAKIQLRTCLEKNWILK